MIIQGNKILKYSKKVLENMPDDWLYLTTHRLDMYDETLAKTQFLEHFEALFNANNYEPAVLYDLPTAYDYIRLGHPLSCLLEWVLASLHRLPSENVISFSSKTAPILAILRKNLLAQKNTQIIYKDKIPSFFDADVLLRVYGYQFDLKKIDELTANSKFNGSTIFLSQQEDFNQVALTSSIDFFVQMHSQLGSVLYINGEQNNSYISEIQHVRRRETIAMTPANSYLALKNITEKSSVEENNYPIASNKNRVLETIKEITGTSLDPLIASSGLSMQYAIVMGLIHDALENHPAKAIKIIVPSNCYGGTNDQARRIAACTDSVEVIDLLVDDGNDMVQSIDKILARIAAEDSIPYIIAEIPTNPRVEIPDLKKLQTVLTKERTTASGEMAIDPVFVLDQTFCPNVHFLGKDTILSSVRAIAYVSGSKFPSGGQCTAGYCVVNKKSEDLIARIALHLKICDNEATALQMKILSKQLPSMNQRIQDAYKNTLEFVNFIERTLPTAKINFVSSALASQEFTPSVFSLDLPTKGSTYQEREATKRSLNHQLIDAMITAIPDQSKFCVSYGQLKGCYWTIPATSTQGTTKEGDKDYIVRVSLSPSMDLELHKKVFLNFVSKFY
tara:strand:+ start:194 stop:2047 length:1854 start_codon:yes stop_codon:yes gene_type:complete